MSPILLLVVCFTVGLAVLLTIKRRLTTNSRRNHTRRRPPSPPKLPILGNLHQVGNYPHRSFARLARQYGPLMLLHFGSRPVLVAATSEAAREVMKTHDLVSSDKPQFKTDKKLLYDGKDVATCPYGEYWRQIRRLCVVHLLSNKKIQSFRYAREEEIGLLVNRIRRSAEAAQAVNLSELLSCLANDVICRMALGRKYGTAGDGGGDGLTNLRDLLLEFMAALAAINVGEFIPWLSWVNRVNGFDARVDRVARQFDELLDEAVLEGEARLEKHGHRNGDSSADPGGRDVKMQGGSQQEPPFMDILLQLHQDSPDEFHLDRDVFVGGTDTTSTLLEWAMAELVKHPRAMKKLQEEVRRESVTNGDNIIREADLDRLEYLKLVVKAAIRLHPPFPLLSLRQLTDDATIMGYDVPAGTMVLINGWGIGRDPADWGESSADAFWPERFVDSGVDFRGRDFQLIPFGSGRRGCPGIYFAVSVVELALANLVRSFDWELPGGVGGEGLDMSECVGFTAHRRLPLLAVPVVASGGYDA